ncbi:FAD-dependent oxidoreductase [Sphingobacterium sp. DK4209]|uniref:FAD-dependent oxidoreductase n=1 Tax=Sphingobacterium zhuxiongii TaxID=2662364 RepID=A0A5Q0QG27_9SPHI|nr:MULTISPECIES: FAD-dependent oxidoreductase [unclassified Sphingobacterium]MVZ66121.1 FAD-dependent oxidoreductase [Sphingobacterium sp. DK4209]QGA26542.1 FAD-dependent oxidoreductase [Sphingobacterium sp. dk4302]
MKNNRRDFLKAIGIGSGALLVDPVIAKTLTEKQIKESEIKGPESVFAIRNLETDYVVAGGGMAGFCAALAAARNGLKVIFIQNRSRLGGNASSEIRMHICGSTALGQVWRETGLLEEVMLTESHINPQRCWEMLDYVMYDKVVSNPNITMLFDTMLYSAKAKGKKIEEIQAYCSQTEEIYVVKAKHFADCTGDGTLAALAGAEFMRGREAKSEYNEALGLEVRDDITMGNSLLFQSQKHDQPMPFKAPSWARKYEFSDFKHRRIHSWEYGYWWIELGGLENIVHDGQKIRHDLMGVVFGVWDYIKNSGNHPESANWALSWFGSIPGKRESRRITGDYVMTQNDILKQENFEDRVAYGGWPLDDHLPAGMDDTSLSPFRSIGLKGPYSIPLRSLYSKTFDNLTMAGRNVSVSHVALSTTRVMATCATMGQAIGTAVAFCVKENLTPRQLYQNKAKLKEYQQILLRQDQAILKVKNEDKLDLALQAKVTASSELPGFEAKKVIDGFNRDVQDGDSHQWRASLASGEQFIELSWNKAQTLKQVEFTFDSGLNRHLRLSGEASVMKNQKRGRQPEMLMDYTVELYKGSTLVKKEEVSENIQRKVVHSFDNVSADRVRLVAKKAQEDQNARVFEIRCYA